MKKLLTFSLMIFFLLTFFSVGVNASVDSIDYPYNNQIVTTASFDLQISTTGASSCVWNYNNVHNYTINCVGDKITLPPIEGTYNITVYDDSADSKTITIDLEFPSHWIIIFFNFLFILIVGGLVGLMLYNVFNIISINFTGHDLIYNFSAYVLVFAIYILEGQYLANAFIEDILLWVLELGSLVFVILPIIGFVITYIKQNMKMGDYNND